jgi:hypothetical protein
MQQAKFKEVEDSVPAACNFDYVENFVITKNFLTPAECKKLVRDCKKYGLMDAEVQVNKDSGLKKDIRDSKILFLSYDNNRFDWFYEKMLQTLVNVNHESFKFDIVGFSEGMQFTEYNAPSGHYSDHNDKLLLGNTTIRP